MSPKKKKSVKKQVKSSLKTGVTVFFSLVIIVGAAFIASLYLFSYKTLGKTVYPKSPLTKEMNTPTSYVENPSLNTSIRFPHIPVMLSVGGQERGYTDYGSLFRYSNDLTLSVYELVVPFQDLLVNDFIYDLYSGTLSGYPVFTMNDDYSDLGYFNGYPSEYNCGVVSLLDSNDKVYRDIYVVSIVMDVGMDAKVCIIVSTENKKALYDAGVLVESVGYTVMDISQTAMGMQYYSVPSPTPESVEEETPEPTPTPVPTADVAQTLDLQIKLLKEYDQGGAVVKLTHTGSEDDMSPVLIYDKEGEVAGTYLKNSIQGISFYLIPLGKMGTYYMQFPADYSVGQYTTSVMSYDDYMSQYGDTAETAPPEMQDMPQNNAEPASQTADTNVDNTVPVQ